MGEQIKPCPFCGGPAKEPFTYNGTLETTCAGPHECPGTDVLVPVAAWNRRSKGPHPESGEYRVGDFIGRQPVLCHHGHIDPNNLCPLCEDYTPDASPPPLEGAVETMDKEIAEALMDSHFLRGVSAGWNAAHGADPEAELAGLKRSRDGHMAAFTARREASSKADGIMAQMPSQEWLSAKVAGDPDMDCEARSVSSKGEALPVAWREEFIREAKSLIKASGRDHDMLANCIANLVERAALPRPASDKGGEPWAWVDPEEVEFAKGGPFRTARAWGHQHPDGFRVPLYARPSPGVSREEVAP